MYGGGSIIDRKLLPVDSSDQAAAAAAGLWINCGWAVDQLTAADTSYHHAPLIHRTPADSLTAAAAAVGQLARRCGQALLTTNVVPPTKQAAAAVSRQPSDNNNLNDHHIFFPSSTTLTASGNPSTVSSCLSSSSIPSPVVTLTLMALGKSSSARAASSSSSPPIGRSDFDTTSCADRGPRFGVCVSPRARRCTDQMTDGARLGSSRHPVVLREALYELVADEQLVRDLRANRPDGASALRGGPLLTLPAHCAARALVPQPPLRSRTKRTFTGRYASVASVRRSIRLRMPARRCQQYFSRSPCAM